MRKNCFIIAMLVMFGSVGFSSCGGDDDSPSSPSTQDDDSPSSPSTQDDIFWKINDFMRRPYAIRFTGSVQWIGYGDTVPAGAVVSYECVYLGVYEFLADGTVYQYTLHSKECVQIHKDRCYEDGFDKDKEWIELEKLKGWYYQDKGKPMTYILNMTKGVLTLSNGEEYIFSYPELPLTLKSKTDGKVKYVHWYDPNEEVTIIDWLDIPQYF